MLVKIAFIATVLLSAGTFIMFLMTWRMCSENFDRLPERIPIHFGFSGKADGWARKSRFSVYWSPVAILVMWVVMMLPLAIAIAESGIGSLPVLVLLPLISFAVSVMFFNITRGTVDYSLGRADSIWPYISKPLIFIIVCSVISPASAPLMISLQKPVLKEAFTSDAAWTGKVRPAPRAEFGPEDGKAYLNLRFTDLNGNPDVAMKWYAPDGSLAFEYKYNRPYRNMRTQRVLWSNIDLDHYRGKGVAPGVWKVIVLRKGKPIKEMEFTVR